MGDKKIEKLSLATSINEGVEKSKSISEEDKENDDFIQRLGDYKKGYITGFELG